MLGEKIRELRKKRKITMKELGMALKLSESAIGMYEKNKRVPDYEILKQIAEYFDVPCAYLLNEGIYGKKALVEEYIDTIMSTLDSDGLGVISKTLKNLDIDTQIKMLSIILKDIDFDEEKNELSIIYYLAKTNDDIDKIFYSSYVGKKGTTTDFKCNSAEQTHIKKYRALDERGRQTIDVLLDAEYSRITPAKAEIDQAEKETSSVVPTNDRRLTRAQAHQLLDEQIDAQEKGKMSSVSIITNGSDEENAG